MSQPRSSSSAGGRTERMVSLISPLVQQEGFSESRLPGVRFMHSKRHVPRSPVTYSPSIVIIVQGRKMGRIGERRFTYDANNYLILAAPMPFECETVASAAEPMYGLSIAVSPSAVAELLLEMERPPRTQPARPEALRALPLDEGLACATERLLEALQCPDDSRILGPGIINEILYRVLKGDEGGTLSALAAPQTHFGQICRVLNRIHLDYAAPHDVASLAKEAGMSPSAFHTHFKQITASSPLQYIKQIRLNKAYLLMVHDGLSASEAAREVGYESASQFNREFKRSFQSTPAALASRRRTELLSDPAKTEAA